MPPRKVQTFSHRQNIWIETNHGLQPYIYGNVMGNNKTRAKKSGQIQQPSKQLRLG